MEKNIIFRNKIFFSIGLIITVLGNITFNFSTNLYLLEKTEKGIVLATNISFSILPLIISAPIMGKIIDKIQEKKKVILFSNFSNLLLMTTMFILWDKINTVYMIYIGILLNNFFSFLIYLTFKASKPQLFPREWLIKANSISSAIDSICGVLSPIIGGFLYSILKIHSILGLNIICIIIAILINTLLVFEKKTLNENYTVKEYKIENIDILKLTVIIGIIFNIGYGLSFSVTIPYIINKIFQLNSRLYGTIQSFFYMGMIVGATLFAVQIKEVRVRQFYGIFYRLGIIFILFLLPLFINFNSSINVIIYAIAMILFGVETSCFDIYLMTFVQKKISEDIIGKYLGIFISISKMFFLMSIFISGIIIDYISYKIIFIIGIFLFTISGIAIELLNRNYKN